MQEKLKNLQLFFTIVAFIFLFCFIWHFSAYGLEITDRSFHWLHMAKPDDYKMWASKFGLFFHPLYLLAGENLVYLRRLVLIIHSILLFCFSYVLLKNFFQELDKKEFLIYLFSFIIFGFLVYSSASYISSYSTMVFWGLLLVSISLIYVQKNIIYSSILLGLAGVIVFLGKPSSALLLAVVSVLFLILKFKKDSIKIIFYSGLFAILFLLLFIYGSGDNIKDFINNIKIGAEYYRTFDPTYNFINMIRNPFILPKKEITAFAFGLIFLIFLYQKNSILSIIGIFLALVLFLLFVFIPIEYISFLIKILGYKNVSNTEGYIFAFINQITLISYVLALFFMIFIFVKKVLMLKESFSGIEKDNLLFSLLFFVFPLIYLFGSNIPYLEYSKSASIFYLTSFFILFLFNFKEHKHILNFFTLFFVILILSKFFITTVKYPSRQAFINDLSFNISINNTNIRTDSILAKYTKDLQEISKNESLNHETYLIDLSGATPFALIPLNLSTYGLAWTLGGYPGSMNATEFIYDKLSCERLAGTWILMEDKIGGRNISPKFLEKYGIYMKDYEKVKDLEIPGYSRDLPNIKTINQYLYKPKYSKKIMLEKCKIANRIVK